MVRIVSARNYVKGETEVRVFADAILNKRVFQAGEVIAAISRVCPRTASERVVELDTDFPRASKTALRRAA